MKKKISISENVLMRLAKLSSSAVKTYAALVRLAGHRIPYCETTYREIAATAEVARSTTVVAIQELSDAGLIFVERRSDANSGHLPNRYTVVLG